MQIQNIPDPDSIFGGKIQLYSITLQKTLNRIRCQVIRNITSYI